MGALVVLAIAVAAVALGAAVVAGRLLWDQVRRLRATAAAAAGRVSPIVAELTEELAVTATEAEAVQAAVAGGRARTPIRGTPDAEPFPTAREPLY